VVAEHVNANRMTIIVLFFTEHKQTIWNSWCVKTMVARREERAFPLSGNGTKNQYFLENLTSAAQF